MRTALIAAGIFCLFTNVSGQNMPPVIDAFSLTPNVGNAQLIVDYTVSDPENDQLAVTLQFSTDGGARYDLALPASGDIGTVMPGPNKEIVVDISTLVGQTGPLLVRLVVDDGQPFDFESLVESVDSNRLRSDLAFIEGIRHWQTGPDHLEAVRDSLRNHFAQLQLHVDEQNFTFGQNSGHNIIGNLTGTTAADTVVIIDAHYDSVSNSPGADDNGSGTAGVLEAARLLSRFPSERTIRFLGFDFEEAGLIGSTVYVSSYLDEHVAGVLNLEMIGFYSEEPNSQTLPAGFGLLFPAAAAAVEGDDFRGNFITNVGNVNSSDLVDLFEMSASNYVPDLRVISVKAPGNSEIAPDLRRSDHTPFWEAGFQAVMITDGSNFRNTCYHTPGDTAENKLNFTFMSNVVRASIATAAELAGSRHGDWATAEVSGLVNAAEPEKSICNLNLFRQGSRIGIETANCRDDAYTFELFDSSGRLLMQQRQRKSSTTIWIDIPSGAQGICYARVRSASGMKTLKLSL